MTAREEKLFGEPELIREEPDIIAGKYPLRVYRTKESIGEKGSERWHYRYHLGWPEALVKPLCPMLECGPYWAEQHWKELDGFWIWFTTTTADLDAPPPYSQLNSNLKFMIEAANQVIRFYKKSVENESEGHPQ